MAQTLSIAALALSHAVGLSFESICVVHACGSDCDLLARLDEDPQSVGAVRNCDLICPGPFVANP